MGSNRRRPNAASPPAEPAGVCGKSVTSCLWPEEFEGLRRGTPASFRHSYPEAVRRRVLDNWTANGFPAR